MFRLQKTPATSEASTQPGGEPGHGRRFGDLLVADGLIRPEQLAEALRIQGTLSNYLPLGQILLNQGWLTRQQLTAVLKRHHKSARLGELLVRAGSITTKQLETALAHQAQARQPLGHALMRLGYVTEETMREALCSQMHVNFFDLDRVAIDPALARLVNEKYATRRGVVPLFRAPQALVVAIDDPTDVALVEELQELLRVRIEIVTSTTAKIQRAIARLYATGSRSSTDFCAQQNIMIGAVRDQQVAQLAAKTLGARILPPGWQSR
ncbi:MAG TPA: hypothetical protein VFV05_07245 [Methylomirabilota bacterium]|nr:hypothetical protein [Methylomirabilota bacterium]